MRHMSTIKFPLTLDHEGRTLVYWSDAPVPLKKIPTRWCVTHETHGKPVYGYAPIPDPRKLYYPEWPSYTRRAAWYHDSENHTEMFLVGFGSTENPPKIVLKKEVFDQ